jgi:hypothetical protein
MVMSMSVDCYLCKLTEVVVDFFYLSEFTQITVY